MANCYPKDLGFRFPAEWEVHEATWLTWPVPHVVWGKRLQGARAEFARLIGTIAQFEPVNLIVRDNEAEKDAKTRLSSFTNGLSNITLHKFPIDDCWLRDNGPLFLKHAEGQVALSDWRFNAWGGEYEHWDLDNAVSSRIAEKLSMQRFVAPMILEGGAIDVNSQGSCLTTKSCLLNQNRNPDLTQADVESYLHNYLNINEIIWLEQGFEEDETDGHIDLLARFVNDETIVCTVAEDRKDENYAQFERNFMQLSDTDYEVVVLPMPERKIHKDGERAPLSYANFYIGNGFVVVPTYDDANDDHALGLFADLFPDRHVIGQAAEVMITGGGSFHCVTQQQPK